MTAKITSKTNHDSLWVKAALPAKSYIKLVINRSGVKTQHTGGADVAPYITAFETVYAAWKGAKSTYAVLIQNTEAAWAAI